jgi:hypothetical protein
VLKERERGIVHHAHRSKECMTNEFCWAMMFNNTQHSFCSLA